MVSATQHHHCSAAFRLVPYHQAIIRQIKLVLLQFFHSWDSDTTHNDIHPHLSNFQQFWSFLPRNHISYFFTLPFFKIGTSLGTTANIFFFDDAVPSLVKSAIRTCIRHKHPPLLIFDLTGAITNITFNLARTLTIVAGFSIIECSGASTSRTSLFSTASAYSTGVCHFSLPP